MVRGHATSRLPGRSNEKHRAGRLGDSPRSATRQIIPPSRLDALALQLESGLDEKTLAAARSVRRPDRNCHPAPADVTTSVATAERPVHALPAMAGTLSSGRGEELPDASKTEQRRRTPERSTSVTT